MAAPLSAPPRVPARITDRARLRRIAPLVAENIHEGTDVRLAQGLGARHEKNIQQQRSTAPKGSTIIPRSICLEA
ncbi:hypothetical protein [Thauera linaloolentis]|uniref:hypothetical protein n=1 Tax=Thauera linaloolentis TaxID=76112 RepID=UPI00055A5FF4|nr:hypothetical protein [Thauera linaloolentis]